MPKKVVKKTEEIPVCIVCNKLAHVYENNIYYCATHMLEKQKGINRNVIQNNKKRKTYSAI